MKQLPRLATLVACLALAAPTWAEDRPTLATVLSAFEAAQHAQVIELGEKVPADAPDAAKVQYLVGESQLVLGKPKEAAVAFRTVLAKRPAAVPAQVGLGRALSLDGQHDEALTVLRATVKAQPKDVAAARTLGEALLAADKRDEGEALLVATLKLAPTDVLTGRALVEARLQAKDIDGAKSVATRLAQANPKHPLADFLLGLALDRADEDEAAIQAYEKALAKDDTFLDAHKNLAILCHVKSNTYQDQVRVKKAFDHYARYFELGGADERLKQMYDTMKAYFEQAPGAPR